MYSVNIDAVPAEVDETQSYEACCCTGDTRLGSVSCTFRKFSGMGNA